MLPGRHGRLRHVQRGLHRRIRRHRPARSTVASPRCPSARQVEIEAWAYKPGDDRPSVPLRRGPLGANARTRSAGVPRHEWGVPQRDPTTLFEFLDARGSPGRLVVAHDAQQAARAYRARVRRLRRRRGRRSTTPTSARLLADAGHHPQPGQGRRQPSATPAVMVASSTDPVDCTCGASSTAGPSSNRVTAWASCRRPHRRPTA